MKKNIRRIAPVAIVLLGLATLSFTAKDGITLKLNPQKGKTYTVKTKTSSMNMMEVQGQTMNSTQASETRQTFTLKESKGDQSVIETQVEAMKLTISQMGMKLEYDSEHPEKTSPMLASQTSEFEKDIKKPFTLTYDAQGNLVSEADEAGMSHLSSAIIKFPKEELSVGSTWTNEKTQNVSGTEFTTNMNYTVTAVSKKSVEVSYKGVVNSTEVTGSVEGTASINPQTGIVMKLSDKQNLSMTISQQGLTIPVTMVVNNTSTVEEK